jgi:hypothetical protein
VSHVGHLSGVAVGWLYLRSTGDRGAVLRGGLQAPVPRVGACAESCGRCSTRSGSRSVANAIAATTEHGQVDELGTRPRPRRRSGRRAQGAAAQLLPGIPGPSAPRRRRRGLRRAEARTCSRVANSNGVTRITGEDRDDIEVTLLKTARAESSEAAEALLDEIRSRSRTTGDRLDLEVEVPRKWNRRGTANLCIKLPRSMEVWVAAERARRRRGIRGLVHAKSTNGSAKISDVIGDVEINDHQRQGLVLVHARQAVRALEQRQDRDRVSTAARSTRRRATA